MAKKFGKVLLFTAAAGAIGAAAYYYMKKKDAELMAELDEDYDDFSEDLDEEPLRSYTPLSFENTPAQTADNSAVSSQEAPEDLFAQDSDEASVQSVADTSVSEEDNFFTPLTEQVAEVAEDVTEELEETVEEFFDEDDEDL